MCVSVKCDREMRSTDRSFSLWDSDYTGKINAVCFVDSS